MVITRIKCSKSYWKLSSLLLVCVLSVSAVYAAKIETKNKIVTGSKTFTIMPYKKTSFSPVRGERFAIPFTVEKWDAIKKVDIEIRTSDNDFIRRLSFNGFKKDKLNYEIKWDGRDKNKKLVPNEVYYPVFTITNNNGKKERIDRRITSGGEELYDFEKKIRAGVVEYTLPSASRVLIRTGIKNGPMLRTIIDWEPRTAGFHAERWNGMDMDNVIAIERNPKVGHLIIGYKLPDYSIITYGNTKQSYRNYREKKKWPLRQASYKNRLLEREGKLIRPEYYTPVLQQKSPRISVNLLAATRKPLKIVKGFDEIITEVKLNPLDEIYLDQERYEISFFINNEFIAEEEQGFVPFTWRWSPGRFGLKPGKHVLTVNVSGYSGQVGVRNIAFTLEADKAK